MTHWRTLLEPSKFLCPHEFPADKEVTISRFVREKMPEREGEKPKSAPFMYIIGRDGKEVPRPLKVASLVMFGLSKLFGSDYEGWHGKKVTLFATMCMAFGERAECIRVRFPANIDRAVRKEMKRKKIREGAYMLTDQNGAPEAYVPIEPPTETDPQVTAGIGQP